MQVLEIPIWTEKQAYLKKLDNYIAGDWHDGADADYDGDDGDDGD